MVTKQSPPRRLSSGSRREKLLGVATELFSEHPYDAVTVDQIASTAGISKALVFKHFDSKRELYMATVQAAAEEVLELTTPDPTLTPPEQLRAGLRAYLRYVEANPVGYRALLAGGVGTDSEVACIVERIRSVIIERLAFGLGVADSPAALRVALHGWFGFVDTANLKALQEGSASLTAMLEIYVAVFITAAEGVREAYPDLKIDIEAIRAFKDPGH